MTVRIEKPAVNVREKLAELDKPTGIAGEAMLRAETPQEQQALIGVGRRNFVINGGFAVDQRHGGAEYTKAGSNYGITGPDRWGIYYDTTKIQQKSVTINGRLRYACRFTSGASSNTDKIYGYTKVESGSAYFSSQEAVLSFWARSNTVKRGVLEFRYFDVGETVEHAGCGIFDQPDFNTAWQYYQIPVKFKQDEDGVSYNRYLFVKFGANPSDVAASDWLEIADVQLELGKVATPFEHRSYGEELALCQRYTWVQERGTTGGSDNAYLGHGRAASTSNAEVIIRNPVVMRAEPEVTLSGNLIANNGAARIGSSYSVQEPSTHSFQITGGGMSSLVVNECVRMYLQNDGETITVDAEL